MKIQGKSVAKTRWEWANYLLPYRSYDSKRTKGINIHATLLKLESLKEVNLDVSLEELKFWIHKKLHVW